MPTTPGSLFPALDQVPERHHSGLSTDVDKIDRRWRLVLPHLDRLRRLARSRLGDSPDVEDCVQEALVRTVAFAGLDEGRVEAFLTTTALRLCVDTYRDKNRQQRLRRTAALVHLPASVEETVCERLLATWMLRETGLLPGRERDVMLARASGLSTVEAAVRMRVTPKAAESAFTRARARLRRRYEDSMDGRRGLTGQINDTGRGVDRPVA